MLKGRNKEKRVKKERGTILEERNRKKKQSNERVKRKQNRREKE